MIRKITKSVLITLLFGALISCKKDDDTGVAPSGSDDNFKAENFTKSIDENSESGETIGTLSTSIAGNSGVTFTLNTQSTSGAITISNTGEVTIDDESAFDYEENKEVFATYTAKKGDESATASITISIKNLKDEPFMYKVKPVLFNGQYVATIGGNSQINTKILEYDFTVDWGDGSAIETITDISAVQHAYSDNNLYTISLMGTIPSIKTGVENLSLAKEIVQWGEVEWEYLQFAFANNPDLVITATDTPDLSNVKSLNNMFENCTNLNTGNFNDWDVSNITNFFEMFKNCTQFDLSLNDWNLSNAVSLNGIFSGCRNFNGNITGWDVSNVEDMNNAFYNARSFNQDISGWKTSNAKQMGGMFSLATSFNQDISDWDIRYVRSLEYTFYSANSFNQDISGWNVSSVTNMANMFEKNTGFNQDLSGWDVNQVTNCSGFALNASLITDNIPTFTNCAE